MKKFENHWFIMHNFWRSKLRAQMMSMTTWHLQNLNLLAGTVA